MGTRSTANIKVTLKVTGSYQNTLDDGTATVVSLPNFSINKSIADGDWDSQANRVWQTSGTLASGDQAIFDLYAMAGIDLGAGSGNDALGQAVQNDNVELIVISNDNDVDALGSLEILPAVSKGWTPIGSHTIANGGAIRGQGFLVKSEPYRDGFEVSIGGSGSHRLMLRASGGSVAYTICLLTRGVDLESSSSFSSSSSSSISSKSSISTSSSSSSSQSASESSISTSSVSSSSSSSSSLSSSSSSSSSKSSSSVSD